MKWLLFRFAMCSGCFCVLLFCWHSRLMVLYFFDVFQGISCIAGKFGPLGQVSASAATCTVRFLPPDYVFHLCIRRRAFVFFFIWSLNDILSRNLCFGFDLVLWLFCSQQMRVCVSEFVSMCITYAFYICICAWMYVTCLFVSVYVCELLYVSLHVRMFHPPSPPTHIQLTA